MLVELAQANPEEAYYAMTIALGIVSWWLKDLLF